MIDFVSDNLEYSSDEANMLSTTAPSSTTSISRRLLMLMHLVEHVNSFGDFATDDVVVL
jgi:hypothetical protein